MIICPAILTEDGQDLIAEDGIGVLSTESGCYLSGTLTPRYFIVEPVTFDFSGPPRRINSNDAGTYITLNPAPDFGYLLAEDGSRITTEG